MEDKLKIGIITNNISLKTGLARCVKAWLPIIYKTNKYDIYFLNQGFSDNDPSFQKYPWKSFGTMVNFDQNRFNQDEGYRRWVSYGNNVVEKFVTENRLDCVIHADDIWSSSEESYISQDWYKHIKQNFIQWTTADSEPILPNFKTWAENCPNMYFWSSFAERALKEENIEKYGHCKTLFPAFNTDDFYPLPNKERLELRRKFNINDDEKVIIYVFRNQLRKQAWALLEGLKEFKLKNPDKKVRLLLHTSFTEPNGWPIDRIRDELKLNKEDVLCTYFCKNCQEWEVAPHDGEDLDCPTCKSKKSRISAGITSTINEKDLNKIYNLADGSCSCPNSGGSELTSQESMLAGIPFASFPYSCGEDYVKNDFVFSLRGTYTREVGTGFKKFVPDIKSITEFYELVYNLSPEKKKDITERARKWTVENFDANVIAGKLESFFDSCKKIDWDSYFNRKKELKNINARIEDKQSDIEFIDHCYKEILNMNLPENDSGKQHWMKFLSQDGEKRKLRESLVNSFRRAAMEHNQKVQPQIPFESLLINNGKKQFLIVCPESAGDCLYVSATLKSFRESYPSEEWNLYLATKPEFSELFDLNPYLDKVLPYQDFMQSEIYCIGQGERKGMFNGYCFVAAGTQKFLNYLSNNSVFVPV
jgi:glycosyltransferase involved in cell wall biosynthesis